MEVNQGGDMVSSVLRATGVRLPIQTVRAARGKYTRAEPIAALYEQGKVVHVGVHSALEDQLCTWTPGDSSPDRLDALCWAAWALMLDGQSQRPRVREY
ncbi:MAG: DNA-packaging protein [Sphingobacteriales bacterium]|nr:DNA-packaging protein [Sphingobacteriales bacterium]